MRSDEAIMLYNQPFILTLRVRSFVRYNGRHFEAKTMKLDK